MYEAEGIHRRPPVANDATVNIVSHGKSDRPIILVLGSYEPVNWILNLQADITIRKVILVSTQHAETNIIGTLQILLGDGSEITSMKSLISCLFH